MRTVAALYVDPRGPYPAMPGVDCWDESRDARLYQGPHPVVAHPPCAPWTEMRRHSGPALLAQEDCGLHAVAVVQDCGGVLEQPARSQLFVLCGLPLPGNATDHLGGRTYEVDQCDWGHVARKPTWLYVVGVDQTWTMRKLRERRGTGKPTHWCSGGRNNKTGGSVPAGIKVCSAQQRRRTPVEFANLLVTAARRSEVQP